MQLWQYIVCALILLAVLFCWLHERRMHLKFAGVRTLPRLPLIGNIHQLAGDGTGLFRLADRITKEAEEAGINRHVVWIGPFPIFATRDPDDVKAITNSFVDKPYFYSFGKVWLGDGLVTAPGSIWKHNIKKLAGTFTSSVVDGYLSVFNAQAHKLVQKLKKMHGKEPFDIQEYLMYTTLEAICQTALGVSKISESIVTTEYYHAFERCLTLLIKRGLNALMHPDFIYNHTPAHGELKKCIAVLHNVSDTVMKKRTFERETLKKQEKKENEKNDSDVPKFRAFLDILLDLKEEDPSLTEQQIKSEVDTIIVAGQETVATTMFYVLLMIGCKPRIQNKLYAEIKEIFGDSTRPATKDDLSQMRYLEAVIYETLRMYPPVPGVMRYADRDLELKSFTIPKGSACLINVWGAGRSQRIWGKDALLYRPERWLADQPPGNPAAFLAFSYGRRACIGKKYAFTILKTLLSQCIRELQFVSNADKMQFKIDIALRPISHHLIQVRRRNHTQ